MSAPAVIGQLCRKCGDLLEEGEVHFCYDTDDAPTLAAFLDSRADVRVIVGPLGSGKSSVCVAEIMRVCQETPPCADGVRRSRGVVVRNTYRELEDTTRATFEDWIPDAIKEWNEADFKCTLRWGDVECEVLFRALDKEAHVRKLLSLELTWAWLNELKEIPRGVPDMLTGRVGRYPRREDLITPENPTGDCWSGIWADTNPWDTDHWGYELFKNGNIEQVVETLEGDRITVRYELFKQPDALAPGAENRKHLKPGYYERLLVGKDEDWVKVYVRAQYGFVREGKPMYPEYRDDVHCSEKLVGNAAWPLLVGMDFGLTPAAVLGQRDPKDGQLQVLHELVSEDMGAVSFGKELRRLILSEYPGRRVSGWGDPAGDQRNQVDERTAYDVIRGPGVNLPVHPAPTNDPTRRLEAVKGMLMRRTFTGRDAIVIHPRCSTLRKGFIGGYCRRKIEVKGQSRYADAPDKNRFSHVHDALQYLAVGEGEDRVAIEGSKSRRVKVRIRTKRAVKGW